MKWGESCRFYGPEDLILETLTHNNSLADFCRAKCVALPNCKKINWDVGKCQLTQFDSSVPAYNFDGTICGWIDHSEPIQATPPGSIDHSEPIQETPPGWIHYLLFL